MKWRDILSAASTGFILGMIFIWLISQTLELDVMIVREIKTATDGYEIRVDGYNEWLFTNRLYTVGDTIKLCK